MQSLHLIETENKQKPFSDQEIVEILKTRQGNCRFKENSCKISGSTWESLPLQKEKDLIERKHINDANNNYLIYKKTMFIM